tara:strand:- start:69102 stop:69515 length:414 start_codon:yes stop_codon:yes gene_type:complete
MNIKPFLLILISVFILTGCSNSGAFIATNSTTVELSEANYIISAKSVTGFAESSYLIGVSTSWGIATNANGLFKLKGTETLYKDAREDFWNKYEADHGSIEGRKLALVNVQFDSQTKNFVVYTYAKVTMTADVVEFE